MKGRTTQFPFTYRINACSSPSNLMTPSKTNFLTERGLQARAGAMIHMMLPLDLLCATRIPTLTMKRLMRRFPGGSTICRCIHDMRTYHVCVEFERCQFVEHHVQAKMLLVSQGQIRIARYMKRLHQRTFWASGGPPMEHFTSQQVE